MSCMFVSLAMSYNQCGLRPVCCAIDTRAIIFVRRAPFLMIRLTWPMDTKIRFRNTLSTPECDDACPDCEISFSVATGKFSDSFKAGGHRIKHQNSYRRPGLQVVLPRSYNFEQFRQFLPVRKFLSGNTSVSREIKQRGELGDIVRQIPYCCW